MLILSLACFVSLYSAVLAGTTITTYSNTDCTQELLVLTPPETGQCQANTLGNYSSLQIKDPTPSCNVSYHNSDYLNCAGDFLGLLQIGVCYNKVTLNQITPDFAEFTVDCNQSVIASAYSALSATSSVLAGTVPTSAGGSSSASTSSPDSSSAKATSSGSGSLATTTVGGSSATPTTSPSASTNNAASSGWGALSKGAQAGIIVAIIVGIVSLGTTIFFGIRNCLHNRDTGHRDKKKLAMDEERLDMEKKRDEIAAADRAKRDAIINVAEAANSNATVDQAANDNTDVVDAEESVPG